MHPYLRPSYSTNKNGPYQREAAAAALLRPTRSAPAPPAPLSLRAEALPAKLQLVAVGNSEEEPELDGLLQEQLARIRGAGTKRSTRSPCWPETVKAR